MHRKADPRGWSALKTISVLLNKTVESVPEMAFPFGEIVLYLSGNTSGNCIGLNVAARAELSQMDHAMLAQVSAGRASVLDGQRVVESTAFRLVAASSLFD